MNKIIGKEIVKKLSYIGNQEKRIADELSDLSDLEYLQDINESLKKINNNLSNIKNTISLESSRFEIMGVKDSLKIIASRTPKTKEEKEREKKGFMSLEEELKNF